MSTQADKPLARDWDRLMADAQAGDANAYRILLSELVVWLRRYYAGRLPPAMTEDAVKNVLLAIHEKRHTYDPRRSFGPWLAAIARYKWIDCLRLLESNAAEPVRENPGIPDHGDGVVSHSTSQQVLAEPKPPQAEALRLAKREIRNVAGASRGASGSWAERRSRSAFTLARRHCRDLTPGSPTHRDSHLQPKGKPP